MRNRVKRLALALAVASAGLGLLAGAAVAPAPAGAAPAAAEQLKLSLVPGASEARYRIRVRVLGGAPREGVCSTRDVGGELVFDPASGAVIPELSMIVIDQRSLRCTQPLRESNVHNLLQTAQYPFAELLVRETPGLPVPFPTEGAVAFQMVGDQTVRGVTRPTVADANATFVGAETGGLAIAPMKMTDFGITPPSIGPLMQVQDDMVVELDFRAASVLVVGDGPTDPEQSPP